VTDSQPASGLDHPLLCKWIAPFGKGGFADLFFEWRADTVLQIQDGRVRRSSVTAESAVAARALTAGREGVLAAFPRADEDGAREAVRRLATLLGSSLYPKSVSPLAPESPVELADPAPWARRIESLVARTFQELPHKLVVRRRQSTRLVVAAGVSDRSHRRVVVSIEGEVRANTRGGPRARSFRVHLPESDQGVFDEIRRALRSRANPAAGPVAPTASNADVLFDEGSAAFLFHEILSHPLEADAPASCLSGLARAKVAPRELDVADEPARLDLLGGYPVDDEGVPGRKTALLQAGHLAGLLRDRAHADSLLPPTGNGRRASPFDHPGPRGSNTVVGPGGASAEEMIHRIGNGLLISDFDGGSVDPASGAFRLSFPSARLIARGRLAQPLSAGLIEGDVLGALAAIDPILGAHAHPCRALGWCGREGQVVPVGGEAPALIVRRLRVRPR
jgi:TldD protein